MKIKPFAILASALLSAATLAHAESFFQIEAGIGAAQYRTGDGLWYQQGMAVSQVAARNLAFSLGVAGPFVTRGNWGIDWRVEYVNLGRAGAFCECTPQDANYNPKTHAYNPNIAPAPLAYYTGYGRSQGFVLALEPYYWTHGVRLGAELGAYVQHAQWQENVYGWAPDYATAPRDLSISTHFWGVVPVVGVSVGDGRWAVAYRHYFTNRQHGGEYPPLWLDVDSVELKYRF